MFEMIMPKGTLGASDLDSLLDSILRKVAVSASENSEGEWAEKYGTDFENDVFSMHPYCWCEKDDCPYCESCSCNHEDLVYFIDGKEVSQLEYSHFFDENVPELSDDATDEEMDKWDQIVDAIEKRRDVNVPFKKQCEFCQKGGKTKPNFHFKAFDLKVWWYKYIGRSTEKSKTLTDGELQEILSKCLESLKK